MLNDTLAIKYTNCPIAGIYFVFILIYAFIFFRGCIAKIKICFNNIKKCWGSVSWLYVSTSFCP